MTSEKDSMLTLLHSEETKLKFNRILAVQSAIPLNLQDNGFQKFNDLLKIHNENYKINYEEGSMSR